MSPERDGTEPGPTIALACFRVALTTVEAARNDYSNGKNNGRWLSSGKQSN